MTDVAPAPAYRHNGRTITAENFYAIACDPRRSVAVEACAGAGKTWMLVSRIVRALLEGMDAQDGHSRVLPHEILAITFTKRAASEMRDRLYQWLAEFARAPEPELMAQLHLRGVHGSDAAPGMQALGQRLSTLYQRVLENGRQVQIRTFHSWFAALLRAAPLSVLQQLGLPPGYELLEDDEAATGLVWRRFYAALARQVALKSDFDALVFEHGRFQTEKALSVALDKRIEFGLADAAGVVDRSVQHFSAVFPDLAALDQPAGALTQPAARLRWLAWAQALGQESNKTPRTAAQVVLEVFADAAGSTVTSTDRPGAMLETLRRVFFVAQEDRLTQHLARYPAAQQAAQELAVLCAAARQHAAWLYQQRMARLTRILLAEYTALKRQRGWIDMPDVERAALVLLSDPVLSGWVQERLDARVRHLLIDEFQDTNPLQWQALLSWLGSYAGAAGRSPSVFIVGDPKQSIYRFRRAEPQVFRAAQEFVAGGLGGDLLSCDHTQRNARQVISTINAAMAHAAATDQYVGFREHTTSSSQSGLACRLPAIPRPPSALDQASGTSSGGGSWRDSLTEARELPEDTLRSLEARQAARWIALQIAGGLAPSDVMVLSRRRVGLLPMQLELRALRIAAQIGEKTALIDCCEVQDLVALLDVLVSNQHDLSLARALKSPLFGLGDDELVALALRRRATGLPWFDLLQQDRAPETRLHSAGVFLRRWNGWLDRLPPHDALQAIYCDGDVLARFAVAAPVTQRDAVLANLRALLAASLQLGGGRYATPYAFVRALKAGAVQAPAVVTEGAVRLLTIHGAKGLEAQVVLLLDTDTPPRAGETMAVLADWPGHAPAPQRFFFLASERHPPVCAMPTLELEHQQRRREELNALYVALTRARHTLVVSSITPHRAAPASWWQRLWGLVGDAAALSGPGNTPVAPPDHDGAFYLKELPSAPTNPALPDAVPADASGQSPLAAPGVDDVLSASLGLAMHRLLEWGDASTHSTAAAAREFDLEPDQGEQAGAMARRILGGQGAWAWDNTLVDWQGNEVELFHHGQLLRLDRLVQRRDTGHWWVLDYKSDRAPQLQPALLEQLRRYHCAVRDIHPASTVRAAFLTAAGELIELAPDGPI